MLVQGTLLPDRPHCAEFVQDTPVSPFPAVILSVVPIVSLSTRGPEVFTALLSIFCGVWCHPCCWKVLADHPSLLNSASLDLVSQSVTHCSLLHQMRVVLS